MTLDEALALLTNYRDSRERMPDAVRALHAAGITKAEIGRRSGLSRMGIDKILARANDGSAPADR